MDSEQEQVDGKEGDIRYFAVVGQSEEESLHNPWQKHIGAMNEVAFNVLG